MQDALTSRISLRVDNEHDVKFMRAHLNVIKIAISARAKRVK